MNDSSLLGLVVIVVGLLIFAVAAFTTFGGFFSATQTLEAITWENWSGEFGGWKTAGSAGLFAAVIGMFLLVLAPE